MEAGQQDVWAPIGQQIKLFFEVSAPSVRSPAGPHAGDAPFRMLPHTPLPYCPESQALCGPCTLLPLQAGFRIRKHFDFKQGRPGRPLQRDPLGCPSFQE